MNDIKIFSPKSLAAQKISIHRRFFKIILKQQISHFFRLCAEYTNVIDPTEEPVKPEGKGGTSTGVIVGVVIAVLIVVLIIGGVIYCKCSSSSKSLPSLSMPSFPASWSSSSNKSPPKPQNAAGFDNPMALADVSEIQIFHCNNLMTI